MENQEQQEIIDLTNEKEEDDQVSERIKQFQNFRYSPYEKKTKGIVKKVLRERIVYHFNFDPSDDYLNIQIENDDFYDGEEIIIKLNKIKKEPSPLFQSETEQNEFLIDVVNEVNDKYKKERIETNGIDPEIIEQEEKEYSQ